MGVRIAPSRECVSRHFATFALAPNKGNILAAATSDQASGATMPPDSPYWVRLNRAAGSREPLSTRSLETIAGDRLGVHFHSLRHTFARPMKDAGAKVLEIQGRLGHSSLQTTSLYLAALRAAENPHGDEWPSVSASMSDTRG